MRSAPAQTPRPSRVRSKWHAAFRREFPRVLPQESARRGQGIARSLKDSQIRAETCGRGIPRPLFCASMLGAGISNRVWPFFSVTSSKGLHRGATLCYVNQVLPVNSLLLLGLGPREPFL